MFSFHSDEKTHAGFKTALDEVCQVVRSPTELPAVKKAMDVYKKRHGKEDQRKQQAGSRSVRLLVKTRQDNIYMADSSPVVSLSLLSGARSVMRRRKTPAAHVTRRRLETIQFSRSLIPAVASVASASVRFLRQSERQRNGIFAFGRAVNRTRTIK